jgi:hypothetical protein
MATRDSSEVARRRVRLDANRPRTHPKPPGRKVIKSRKAFAERCTRPDEDGDVLEGLSRAISLVETVAVAMQTHDDDSETGPIAEALDVACCELRRVYGAVDLALRQVKR